MKSKKSFFKRPIGIITGVLIVGLLTAMTYSDIYYSKLERNYPLLTRLEQIEGTIVDHKDHFDYTYIVLNTSVKRLIMPTENSAYSPSKFSDFISEGDQVIYQQHSDQIEIVRGDNSYYFEFLSPD